MVVSYNAKNHVLDCLASLTLAPPICEIIVVDNASTDGTTQAVSTEYPNVRLLSNQKNQGFPKAINFGVAEAISDTILVLDSDVIVDSNTISRLYDEIRAHPGVVGPAVFNGNSLEPDSGSNLDLMLLPKANSVLGKALFVQGCCFMTTRSCFESVGGYDERYFLVFDDVEYCWQVLRHGYDVRVVESVKIWHKGGTSNPGGYQQGHDLHTTVRRILLRERNSYIMLIACAPLKHVAWLLPLSLLRTVIFTAFLLYHQKIGAAFILWRDIWKTVFMLPGTISRRKRAEQCGKTASQEGWVRLERRLYLLDHLRDEVKLVMAD